MSKTYDQGREEIAKLCKYFATNRQAFFAAGVKEAHVRQSLIDPFFEALGWDMRNAAMVAPQYREVVTEDSLEIEGQQKAPDYTFRVGTLAKFYTEAKKCGININVDPGPSYQLRRYGWSAKVPLSILTDFEELGVYDCTIRPRPVDKASYSRIQYFRSEEYADRWRELWDIFSREAVWAGAYDKFAASKRKRGTSEVDSEFLKEIEGWRDSLARNIALRNLYLGYDDLNTAVQRTIDRLIFLRMAEDRGSESYGQLLKLCEQPEIYARFMKLCRKADEKYNSGIFHFQKEAGVSEQHDRLTPALTIDDKVIKPIMQNLYFEHGSPYHFGVLPVEILGTVYERFLGKVIRLTAGHQAKVEEKPEVRKAGGVYYTPAYIVNYIVQNTVGKQIEGKSPADLAGGKTKPPFRVLDMACGSGSFLLGAFQCLLDHCLKWYLENHPEKHKEAVYLDSRGKYWRLTINEKKRILITHIFGVDIDLQAVEVSKLSLLLKVLEGETDETVGQSRQLFHKRALPNLANNIKCGNSLIGPDYFSGRLIPDPDEMKRVNPFDWQREFPDAMHSGGFDCVIGNPPYIRMEEFKEYKFYYKNVFLTHSDRADIFYYFIEKAISLLIKNGKLGFILSNTFARSRAGRSLRSFLLNHSCFEKFVDFGDFTPFLGATVYPIIVITAKSSQKSTNVDLILQDCDPTSKTLSEQFPIISHIDQQSLTENAWIFDSKELTTLRLKLFSQFPSLKEVFGEVGMGIKTGLNEAFLISNEEKENIIKSNKNASGIIKPYVGGKDLDHYYLKWDKVWIIYTQHGIDLARYPKIREHLEKFKTELSKRATRQAWYELQQPQEKYSENFNNPKIIFPDISRYPKYCLDINGLYFSNTIYFIKSDSKYLLGLLNSKLLWFMIRGLSNALRGGQWRFRLFSGHVEKLPIRTIDSTNKNDNEKNDRMIKLVEAMLKLMCHKANAKTQNEQEIIKRQIVENEAKIDKLVYELYELTEEEIKIVEDGTTN